MTTILIPITRLYREVEMVVLPIRCPDCGADFRVDGQLVEHACDPTHRSCVVAGDRLGGWGDTELEPATLAIGYTCGACDAIVAGGLGIAPLDRAPEGRR